MVSISQRIETLCDQLVAKLDEGVQRGGGLILDFGLEPFRLRNNGIQMPELSFSELQVASVGLLRVLALRNGAIMIDQDHWLLWSWLAEVIHADPVPLPPLSREVTARTLLGVAVRAALTSVQPSIQDRNVHALLIGIDQLLPLHLKELKSHSHELMAYLAFPGLEAALRYACREFVGPDGRVIKGFSVTARKDPYVANGKSRCNSVRDLLCLHYEQVADAQFKSFLDRIRQHLALLAGSDEDPFELLYRWRNSTLHGEELSRVGGMVLTFGLLIALHNIEGEFPERQACAQKRADWYERESIYRRSFGFYPPT